MAIIADVPRISVFYGIVIEMYFGDHPPPHFHARYGGEAAKIEIASGEIIAGTLPGRACDSCENGWGSMATSSRRTGVESLATRGR